MTPLPHSFPRSLSFPSHVLTYSLASSPCSRPVCSLPQNDASSHSCAAFTKTGSGFTRMERKESEGADRGTRRRGHVRRSRKDGGPGRLSPAAALPTGADGPVVPLRGEGWRSGEGAARTFCFSHLLGGGGEGCRRVKSDPLVGLSPFVFLGDNSILASFIITLLTSPLAPFGVSVSFTSHALFSLPSDPSPPPPTPFVQMPRWQSCTTCSARSCSSAA